MPLENGLGWPLFRLMKLRPSQRAVRVVDKQSLDRVQVLRKSDIVRLEMINCDLTVTLDVDHNFGYGPFIGVPVRPTHPLH